MTQRHIYSAVAMLDFRFQRDPTRPQTFWLCPGEAILVLQRPADPSAFEAMRVVQKVWLWVKPMVPFWGRCTTHFSLF